MTDNLLNQMACWLRQLADLDRQLILQLHCSALIFAPRKSIVREQCEKCITTRNKMRSKGQENWSSTLQTLEGHFAFVSSLAFSLYGKVLASGSSDKTVQFWDANTGAALETLKSYSAVVSVRRILSILADERSNGYRIIVTLKIWLIHSVYHLCISVYG